MSEPNGLAWRLRASRRRTMSQEAMGEAVGKSASAVRTYELGHVRIDAGTMKRWAEAAGCSVGYLSGERDHYRVAGSSCAGALVEGNPGLGAGGLLGETRVVTVATVNGAPDVVIVAPLERAVDS